MEEMVHVYFFGKQYEVPGSLTIMRAMEYAGYQLVRGCGCRNGFCGACATLYRVKGKQELKSCLACQTQVEEGMLATARKNLSASAPPTQATTLGESRVPL